LQYRPATLADVRLLAEMNAALIRDEAHRNRMTVEQLAERMAGFLTAGYEAVIFEREGQGAVGYALYQREPDWVYLRQFYVTPECRRRGIGRAALAWLRTNAWADSPRIRLEVLTGNSAGIAFWRAVGFADYCLTLELERVRPD
jgi:GNAT superfamily N-acetyltransferase